MPRKKKPKAIKAVGDLKPDAGNLNGGNKRGHEAIRTSLEEVGFGRSLVADRNGVIMAGNKTSENLTDLLKGNPPRVVQTNGDEVVIHQRMDLDLSDSGDTKPRLLAIADNRTNEISLTWRPEMLENCKDLHEKLADMDLFSSEEMQSQLSKLGGTTGVGSHGGGTFTEEDSWPIIQLRIPPELMERWTDALDAYDGKPWERVAQMVESWENAQ